MKIRSLKSPQAITGVLAALGFMFLNSDLRADSGRRPQAVRVWEDSMTIPTSEEQLPDPNPPFDFFNPGRFFNYPTRFAIIWWTGGRRALGKDERADYIAASNMPTNYVFPSRPESFAVLQRAIEVNPKDATAHFLLGSLYLSGGISKLALQECETARGIDPAIPTLHRNKSIANSRTEIRSRWTKTYLYISYSSARTTRSI